MRFEGTLPTNIVAGETYFVRLIATDLVNWNLSTTPNLEAAFVQTDGVHTGNPLNATFQNHFVDADGGIIPDLGLAPPRRDENVFTFADNFPAAVGYFEQRRVFAGTETEPHFVWMTKSGTESDLSFSLPVRDSDRIKVRALARSGSTIAHLVPLNDLIMLSNEEEFRVTSVNQDAVSPSSISIKTQTYVGASTAQPVVVNSTLIFAAARGGHLREMGYSVQANSYLTGDISLRATHLFDTLSIVDLTYAKAPQPVLWLTSSNGKLLSLTYVPEEQIGAWAQHDTDGTFETCVAVSEVDGDGNDEDFLYVVVNRDIAGLAPSTPRRYVERMVSRETQAISDSCFLDSCLTYDGVATTIIGIASSPVVDLTHLEGETVSALADGLVVTGLLVTSGTIVLPTAAAKVHIGLPYTSDLQTLPAAIQMEALGQGREKNVSSIDLRLFLSAGASVGPTVNDLLKVDPYEVAGQLRTESVETVLTPAWSVDGQIFLRQTDPLPVTVVGITMKLAIGD